MNHPRLPGETPAFGRRAVRFIRRSASLLALAAAACASDPQPQDPPHDKDPETQPEVPPTAETAWSAPGFHIAGMIPAGWTREPSVEPTILSIVREDASIDLRVLIVEGTTAIPGDDLLRRLTPRSWKAVAFSTLMVHGVAAARADFEREEGASPLTSSQVAWEWYEGATPGRKFIFHAMMVCDPETATKCREELEGFLGDLAIDHDGPAIDPVRREMEGGWVAVTLPKERAITVSGIRIPALDDPFCNRAIPLAAWVQVKERMRERRTAGEELTPEERWQEALALYNIALDQMYQQIGASDEHPNGAKLSTREFIQFFCRVNAALAVNVASVLKLSAMRDGRSWRDAERLVQNATVMQNITGFIKEGRLTGDSQSGLAYAAAAPVGDYRELAFSLGNDIPSEQVVATTPLMARALQALKDRKFEEAEEIAREVLAATEGRWPEAHRLIAAAQFADGRLANAAGSARRATEANPRAPGPVLEEVEILVAANRPEEAIRLLDDFRGPIAESLSDLNFVGLALRASAHLRAGREIEAGEVVSEMLKKWEEGPKESVNWDFSVFTRNLPAEFPGLDRILATTEFLTGRASADNFRLAWGLPRPR